MLICDLNCDMGEGMDSDADIMPFITSANIACGFHAGNDDSITKTIALALQYGVHVGAHPSFSDRENFGRKEMYLSNDELYGIMLEQLIKINAIVEETGERLHHVKPHGALYNMAAKNAAMANTIARATKDFNDRLVLYGLSNSFLISEAKALGLKTASEVFADRTYSDDGTLTPRSREGALIEDGEQAVRQVLQMIKEGTVTTTSGNKIPIVAETICIHGDGKHALRFAKKIHEALKQQKPEII
jgi:UPF0271 protein